MAKTAKEKIEEVVKKRLKEGWIKSGMMIEVLAGSEDAAKKGLENHIKKMDREDNTIIYKMDYKEIAKVEKPVPNVKEAYSYVVDLELLTNTYEKLFYLVLNYGPSSVEILEPKKIFMDVGEAQGILNSVSEILHNFAARMVGGIHIREE